MVRKTKINISKKNRNVRKINLKKKSLKRRRSVKGSGGCGQFGYWNCDSATSSVPGRGKGKPICKWCGSMLSGNCVSKTSICNK